MAIADPQLNQRHFASCWIALGIFFLPFVLFLPVTLGQQAFYEYDLQCYFIPYRIVAASIVRSRQLPLWNPYANSGMPLLGDGQVALLWPPNWISWFIQPLHGLMLAMILTYSIAGIGMFTYARQLRMSRSVALIGAIAFMFSGIFGAHAESVSVPATAAMIPWIFWGLELLIERITIPRLAAAGMMVALQLCAGHPQIPAYCSLAVTCYALVLAAGAMIGESRTHSVWRPILCLMAIYAIGVLLASVQLLPWLELIRLSPRSVRTPAEMFASNSIVGTDWLLFLFPYGYGGLQTSWLQSARDIAFPVIMLTWERMPYVGLLPLALAMTGILDIGRLWRDALDESLHRAIALIAVLVLMLILAAGYTTPVAKIVYHIPVFGQFRAQARAAALTTFALCALAMFGLQRVMARRTGEASPRRFDWITAVPGWMVLAAIVVALIAARGGSTEGLSDRARGFVEVGLNFTTRNAGVPLILAGCTAIVTTGLAIRRVSRINVLAAIALVCVDLGGFCATFLPTRDPASMSFVPAAANFLNSSGTSEPFRVAVFAGADRVADPQVGIRALTISWTMAFGIESIDSFNSLQPRRVVDFLVSTKSPDITYGLMNSARLREPYNRALNELDVKYAVLQKDFPWNPPEDWLIVYADDAVEIRRNPAPVTRAFLATSVEAIAGDGARVLAVMHHESFDPLQFALVEAGLTESQTAALSRGMSGSVELLSRSNNEQTWHVQTSLPRLLVLSEMYFPGWIARFRPHGSSAGWRDLPIYRTNYLLRGIPVPPGDNDIRMVYRPLSVIIGFAVSMTTVAAMSISWIILAMRRRKHQSES